MPAISPCFTHPPHLSVNTFHTYLAYLKDAADRAPKRSLRYDRGAEGVIICLTEGGAWEGMDDL